MKKLFLLLASLPLFCNAQTTIKLYTNFGPEDGYVSYSTASQINNLQSVSNQLLLVWSVAVNKQLKKNRFVEFELGNLDSRKESYIDLPLIKNDTLYKISFNSSAKSIACRFEFGKTILGNRNPKNWSLLISHSLQPYYLQNESIPITTNAFPIKETKWMVNYAITSHINYMVNKHLGFDVNVPIQLLQFGSISQTINNPNVQIANRSYSIFDLDALNKANLLSLRCGLIYKI
jgi:hypothetical protein